MLVKKYNSKIKQELLDVDYIDKLNDEEKDFLNRFLEETVNARFDHDGKKIYRKKKDQLELYQENNSRNRCQYNIAKVTGRLEYDTTTKTEIKDVAEDVLIELIDRKNEDN